MLIQCIPNIEIPFSDFTRISEGDYADEKLIWTERFQKNITENVPYLKLLAFKKYGRISVIFIVQDHENQCHSFLLNNTVVCWRKIKEFNFVENVRSVHVCELDKSTIIDPIILI
jgi:hypothetical protein